jgi:hypothetical protein
MNYLDALDAELKQAGIPPRRRTRIVAEFADHLEQDPTAELGAPHEIARQFADELGTRLARNTAYVAFAALAAAGIFLLVMFLTGGRQHGWAGYGNYGDGLTAVWWWVPLQLVCVLAAQVALASGLLALIRAYRLRGLPTITSADAASLNRRAAVGLIAGAVAMAVLPLTWNSTSLGWPVHGLWWPAARYGGIAAIVALLALLPSVLAAARLRPQGDGIPGNLTTDLGISDARITPSRVALGLSALIVVVLTVIGIGSDDPIDGFARGLADAAACLAGFALLGSYLGLQSRTTG